MALEDQFPGIAVVEQSGGHEFRTVDHRAAAYGQQEIDPPLLAERHGLAQRLDRRVGFDAPELDEITAFEGPHDLLVDPVALDAAAAEGDHDPPVGGDQFRKPGDLPLAEHEFGRIVINEIVHISLY